MELIINDEFVAPYFKHDKKHKNYNRALDEYYHNTFHFDGFFIKGDGTLEDHENPYFVRLIEAMRPGETKRYKDWRKINFIPMNKIPCYKVLNALKKGVRSEDWKIDFSTSEKPAVIKETEQLEKYTEKNYPYFKSVENWLVSFGIKKLITDPNGVIVVMPEEFEVKTVEYQEPYTFIIDSKKVLDFKEKEYCVFVSDRECTYYQEGKTYDNGRVITIVTKNEIWEAEQRGIDKSYELILKLTHNIGELPAWQLGGFIKKQHGGYMLFESFISSMLPAFDMAAGELSDLRAEVIQHIFSTMWRMDGQDCNDCKGSGMMPTKTGQVVCGTCKGDGNFRHSPEKAIVIKQSAITPGNVPTPPAGYISKPTDIVKLQAERIKDHQITALSSIGFDFLIPNAQSGIAKAYDREEANNFVYGVYYHIVENIMKPAYFFINEYRNKELIADYEARQKLLPKINIPQRFDIFSEGVVMSQIVSARTAEVDSIIIDQLEIDLVQKYFYNDPEVRDKIITVKICDPLPGLNTQEKSDLKLAGAVTNEDFVLSTYIQSFVEQAAEDYPKTNTDGGFFDKTRKEKLVILQAYAKAKMLEIKSIPAAA